ncbi:VENN motif pre-toxin domain-containing protein [Proteus cibi]|uniref:VENN motif pre-toxin domain-containing protein n=1 Tax=Proteus cibi TaxID=2050966 RepID=UPI0032D9B843
MHDSDNQQQDIAQLSQDTDNAHSTLNKIFDKEKEQNRQQKQQLVGESGAQIIDLATTVDTIRGTNIAKDESTLNRLSDTAYDDIYQALSETNDNVTECDVQNYLFQQRLQDYTNQSDFGTGGKYTRAIQAVTAFTQGIMGNNIVTAIANGSAPYLANEVKNQIQGNSVESDIQRTVAHGLVNAGLALAKGENAMVQAAGAMTGETMGILSHSLYGKTPEELTESEKQNISAWATLASGIAGGLISDNSAGVANAAQAGKVVVENNSLTGDKTRESLKQSNEWWKQKVRDTLGENLASQVANGILNAIAETGDAALFVGDSAFDATAVVVTCGLGDSYCQQAISDLNKKDQTVSNAVSALINGESWKAVKDTANKAAEGDQKALENLAGMLTTILTPAKALTTVEKGAVLAEKGSTVISGKPKWLKDIQAGNKFNAEQSKNYPYNELYVNKPDGSGYYRVDSYNPATGEIVSRKFTQFSEITETTAKNYIHEAVNKYPAGATISKVPSSGPLAGSQLKGANILEVPPQNKPIPQPVLDAAKKANVMIRDINGKIYK